MGHIFFIIWEKRSEKDIIGDILWYDGINYLGFEKAANGIVGPEVVFVDSVGKNDKMIANDIKNQLEEDHRSNQISLNRVV